MEAVFFLYIFEILIQIVSGLKNQDGLYSSKTKKKHSFKFKYVIFADYSRGAIFDTTIRKINPNEFL